MSENFIPNKEFTPPLTSYKVISFHENENGDVDSVGLFALDAMKRHYTMRVVTEDQAIINNRQDQEEQRNYSKISTEFSSIPTDTDNPQALEEDSFEPEFVIPGKKITNEDIEQIVSISPKLLEKFLVAQE